MRQRPPAESNFTADGVTVADLREKLSSLQVVAAKNPETSRQLSSEFGQRVARDYAGLMQRIEADYRITFYATQQGEMINDLVMVADSDTTYTVIQVLGLFTASDIQNITKSRNP